MSTAVSLPSICTMLTESWGIGRVELGSGGVAKVSEWSTGERLCGVRRLGVAKHSVLYTRERQERQAARGSTGCLLSPHLTAAALRSTPLQPPRALPGANTVDSSECIPRVPLPSPTPRARRDHNPATPR